MSSQQRDKGERGVGGGPLPQRGMPRPPPQPRGQMGPRQYGPGVGPGMGAPGRGQVMQGAGGQQPVVVVPRTPPGSVGKGGAGVPVGPGGPAPGMQPQQSWANVVRAPGGGGIPQGMPTNMDQMRMPPNQMSQPPPQPRPQQPQQQLPQHMAATNGDNNPSHPPQPQSHHPQSPPSQSKIHFGTFDEGVSQNGGVPMPPHGPGRHGPSPSQQSSQQASPHLIAMQPQSPQLIPQMHMTHVSQQPLSPHQIRVQHQMSPGGAHPQHAGQPAQMSAMQQQQQQQMVAMQHHQNVASGMQVPPGYVAQYNPNVQQQQQYTMVPAQHQHYAQYQYYYDPQYQQEYAAYMQQVQQQRAAHGGGYGGPMWAPQQYQMHPYMQQRPQMPQQQVVRVARPAQMVPAGGSPYHMHHMYQQQHPAAGTAHIQMPGQMAVVAHSGGGAAPGRVASSQSTTPQNMTPREMEKQAAAAAAAKRHSHAIPIENPNTREAHEAARAAINRPVNSTSSNHENQDRRNKTIAPVEGGHAAHYKAVVQPVPGASKPEPVIDPQNEHPYPPQVPQPQQQYQQQQSQEQTVRTQVAQSMVAESEPSVTQQQQQVSGIEDSQAVQQQQGVAENGNVHKVAQTPSEEVESAPQINTEFSPQGIDESNLTWSKANLPKIVSGSWASMELQPSTTIEQVAQDGADMTDTSAATAVEQPPPVSPTVQPTIFEEQQQEEFVQNEQELEFQEQKQQLQQPEKYEQPIDEQAESQQYNQEEPPFQEQEAEEIEEEQQQEEEQEEEEEYFQEALEEHPPEPEEQQGPFVYDREFLLYIGKSGDLEPSEDLLNSLNLPDNAVLQARNGASPPIARIPSGPTRKPSGPMREWGRQSVAVPPGIVSSKSNEAGSRWGHGKGTGLDWKKPSWQVPNANIHRSSNAYKIGQISDEEQSKQRQFQDKLNKLTPTNFDKLYAQMLQIEITSPETLRGLIHQIFDKALIETSFCPIYSDLCKNLATDLPQFSEEEDPSQEAPPPGAPPPKKRMINFRRLLLNKCQEEFEKGATAMNTVEQKEDENDTNAAPDAASSTTPAATQQTKEEKARQRAEDLKARRRALGNMQFIGQLFSKGMLTENIMHSCIQLLLNETENPRSEDLEQLSKLLFTVGALLDAPSAKLRQSMVVYMKRIEELTRNSKLDSRIKFMLLEVIETRSRGWEARRKVEGPKTIQEIHKDAEAAMKRTTSSKEVPMARRQRSTEPAPMSVPPIRQPPRQQPGEFRPLNPSTLGATTGYLGPQGRGISLGKPVGIGQPQGAWATKGGLKAAAASTSEQQQRQQFGGDASQEGGNSRLAANNGSSQSTNAQNSLLDQLRDQQEYDKLQVEIKLLLDEFHVALEGKLDEQSAKDDACTKLLEGLISSRPLFEQEDVPIINILHWLLELGLMKKKWVQYLWIIVHQIASDSSRLRRLVSSASNIESAVKLVLHRADMFCGDSPVYGSMLGFILSKLVENGVLDFRKIGEYMLEAGDRESEEDPSPLVDEGGAIIIICETLKGLVDLMEVDGTMEIWRNSQFKLKQFAPQGDDYVIKKMVSQCNIQALFPSGSY